MFEATSWGEQPDYRIHDRDRVYYGDIASQLADEKADPLIRRMADEIGEMAARPGSPSSARRQRLEHPAAVVDQLPAKAVVRMKDGVAISKVSTDSWNSR